MNGKSCFFIGHRHAPDSISERLIEVVEQHILEYGVTTFIVGHYGSFDRLVAAVLRKAKEKYQDIKLYLLIPYHPSNQRVNPIGFDGTLYPEGMKTVPKLFAIFRANRDMIENSDYLISYCKFVSNTRNFVEYALRREKKGFIKVTLL